MDRHAGRHRAWRSAMPTAAPTAPWMRCASDEASADSRATTATTFMRSRADHRNHGKPNPVPYLLTDFLVKGFHRSVIVELGLDRYPELREDYFGNYRQVVWLAGSSVDEATREELAAAAHEAAAALGLPLVIRPVGRDRLGAEVEALLSGSA